MNTLEKTARAALDYFDRNTCQHEDTHRGGFLWTICSDCGKKWADDEGGFVPYSDPPAIANLRAALDAAREKHKLNEDTETPTIKLLQRLPEIDCLLDNARAAINRGEDALPYIGRARNFLDQMYGKQLAPPTSETPETAQPKVVQFSEGDDWFTVLLSDGRMFRAAASGTRWVPILLDNIPAKMEDPK